MAVKRIKNPNKRAFNKAFNQLTKEEKAQLLKVLAEKFNLIRKEG